ncbi:hypothetical protein BO83DRAFT_39069 [Aspergillus eucalypticola CBS 122712]|uniref:Uncharacterized protein n=1 Tax=Aspergillus eucalypticola (strain CBS 122712 / IBT 29274) TaxID=1448314 RepID=A0A317VLG4_ASPEC|nr:uncharacterized protein BO83DRAFT_39069 [Aspergillus eucalypticola CBS 122712]PWY72730.1 hypothetical protein BO83DRAFT_39069 [Aspergillus eucalypticola CBS 122712]
MPPSTPQYQSHPRSPSTTSDGNNTVTWEHLEHAPPSLQSQSRKTTADNHSERVISHEMHARSGAVHVEVMMGMHDGIGTGTGKGMGPGAGRAPAIRIHPPGDTVSTLLSGASGVGSNGDEGSGGCSTKSASFSGSERGWGGELGVDL